MRWHSLRRACLKWPAHKMEAAAILGPDKEGEDMKTEHSYSAKGVLAALGRSALYQLFFVAVQVLLPFVYGIGIAADAAINRGADLAQGAQAVAERLLDGLSALTLLSCLIIAAVLLLWFLLRRKPLSEAAGLRHCSGWTVGFCAFGAVGLYVLVSLVLALLPESWMEEYGKAMRLSTETGLIPALAVVAGAPVAEELVFRGVIQSRLERAMPVWIAIVLQAVLFGFIHGTPVQIGYAFLMGLLFGYIRYRTGSILPTIAAHAAFNAMNDPLGLLGGFAEKWQFLAVMAAVCAAGCVLCRRGLSGLRTAPEAEARPTSPTVCEEITE